MRRISFLIIVLLVVGCKRTPMDRVASLRDQLAGDAPRFDLPACSARDACAGEVARAMGAKFEDKKPDQVSAAAVAVVIGRDHHGSDVAWPDVWMAAMRKGKGDGADALRLAVALGMSEEVGKHARPLDSDADARGFLASVAATIPGACKTYEALGAGASLEAMPPQDSPDHDACVQRDLERPGAPGAAYGQGLFRAAAAALALWKAELAALHEGSSRMEGRYKTTLDRRVAVLDDATPKIAPKLVAAPAGNVWAQTKDEHAASLAGDAGHR